MVNKEQKSKKAIAAEVIHSEKSFEIFNHIEKIKEKIINLNNSDNSSKLFEFINRLSDEIDYLGEELMKQDIRVSIATGLIELHPYPTCCETEKQRLEEVNREIEKRVKSKNFPKILPKI